ncbi:MAG TPA: tetratricopeptide repeat protein, partial [Bryobacteraceae bacterium]|nr:tetratricopeptide repeat protein [Bryobacteraceae bacterium]
ARRVFICTLFGGIGLCAQGHRPTSAAAMTHIGKGYELVQNDRFAEAAQEFRAALALEPGAANARYQLAVCLFAVGEREASRKEFERLSKEMQNDPSVAYYLARLDLVAGDAAAAIRRLAPLMAHPPFSDAAFYLGSAYLAQGDREQAIHWLRKAAQSDPRDFRIHYRLARALQQNGLRKESEQEYALSTEMREHYNETARQSTACVQALRAEPADRALEICGRLFDPNDPDKLTTLGMLFGENGKFEEAIEPLRRAAQLDPDSFEVYHNLGLTYFRLKRFAEARAPLEKAVSLRPDYFGSNALLGATLYSLKDDGAAFRVLDFAHQLKPDDADTAELLFRVSVILANQSAADPEAALRFLEKAALLRPGNPELTRRIAEIQARLAR